MTTAELEGKILAWKKAETKRVLSDLGGGLYGNKGSLAKRDVALIDFEARRLFDEVEAAAVLVRTLEKRVLSQLAELSGVSVLKGDLFEQPGEVESGKEY